MKKFFGLVVLLLGLAALAFSVKTALTGTTRGGETAPKRQLDNVRTRAGELEREQQRHADELEKKADDSAR